MKKYSLGLAMALVTMLSAVAVAEPISFETIEETSTPQRLPSVSQTIAQAPMNDSVLQEKLRLLEQKQQQLEQEIESLRQQLTSPKPVTPVVTVPEDDPQRVEVSAQVLFLKPAPSNLMDFAIVDPGTALAVSGDLAKVDYERAEALRVGLTYRPEKTAWTIGATHTFFDTDGRQQAVRPETGALFSTFTHPFQNESADTAAARATLNYNATDVELAYNFQVGKSLGLRVMGGLRFSDVDQKMTVDYNGRDFTNSRAKIESRFSGFGPRLGAEAHLQLASDLSLFGRGTGSLLLGGLSARYEELDNDGADVVARLSQNRDQHLVPGLDLAIGLRWQPKIGQRANLDFSIGYEYQHLFNVAESIRFVDASSPGVFTETQNDLSLQGFFLRLGLSSEF